MGCYPEAAPPIGVKNLPSNLEVDCPQCSPNLPDPSPNDLNCFIHPRTLGFCFWTGLCGGGSGREQR